MRMPNLMCLALVSVAAAQSPQTENTLKLDEPSNSPKATVKDIAWFTGHWQGDALGGLCDEYWSEPIAGTMMGMFRLVKNGKVVFYELSTALEENGTLAIRLKHFHPDLKGWEAKDDVVLFPLVKITKDAAWFDGMTFKKTGPDTMDVFVAMGKKGEQPTEAKFAYRRARR